MSTGPIAPEGLIAADDYIVDAWIYAGDPENKITVCVTRLFRRQGEDRAQGAAAPCLCAEESTIPRC